MYFLKEQEQVYRRINNILRQSMYDQNYLTSEDSRKEKALVRSLLKKVNPQHLQNQENKQNGPLVTSLYKRLTQVEKHQREKNLKKHQNLSEEAVK